MSYTRPVASASDATWLGSAAYTRPLASAADASFFVNTSSISVQANGIAPTLAFGVPAGLIYQLATGISSTQFSTPALILQATGFGAALFGTSIGKNYFPAQTLGAITKFGAPTSPSPQTVQATGTTSLRLGFPFAFKYAPINLAVLGQAFGITSEKIGIPSAGWRQTGYASGMSLTTFGGPASARSQQLAGFSSTLFGTSSVSLTQRASGFNTMNAGTPVSGLLLQATSTAPKLSFGQPAVLRSNTFSTYGINASCRFGMPSGFCRFNRFATGFVSGALGTPTCFQRHRVAPASPETRFGQPLLKRVATC